MIYYSPIILFIYKRPEHLKKTLESLSKCNGYENHSFFVFGDGPKDKFEETAVQKTRKVVNEFLGNRAQYFFSPVNKGLANSVIEGISKILEQFSSVIVIEDDLIFHPFFLTYMNMSLNKYQFDENVSMVSGYMYNVPEFKDYRNQIFLPLISTWGWGTWSRAWKNFDKDAKGYEILMKDKDVRKRFDCNGSYPFSQMLELQMKGKIDSWGIRWYWSIFKNNGLNCFPPTTLVLNNGFDATATHGRGLLTNFQKNVFSKGDDYEVDISEQLKIKLDNNLYQLFCNSMYNLNGGKLGQVRDLFKKYFWNKIKKRRH